MASPPSTRVVSSRSYAACAATFSSEIERAEKDGEPSRYVNILRSWLQPEVDQ